MLPRRNCLIVMSDPASMPWLMRNMLATEFSNPRATKVLIGMKMPINFPVMVLLAIAIHTAKHTNQLHNTPFAKSVPKPMDTYSAIEVERTKKYVA